MKDFDVNDTRNVYRACRVCRRATGMGLVTRWTDGQPMLAVECECGTRGPGIEENEAEGASIIWHERDRMAFDAWNLVNARDGDADDEDAPR